LLARIRHWNRDRGCEHAQLVERARALTQWSQL
jgi:hypothetical protein